MKKYSNTISIIIIIVGILIIFASLSSSDMYNTFPFIFGIIPLILGVYMRINNKAREEMLKNIIILNSTPDDEKDKVIKLLKEPKKTSLLVRLLILFLILIIVILLFLFIFLLFDISIKYNPEKINQIFMIIK